MATILYREPAVFVPENAKSMPVRKLTPGAGHTTTAIIQRADIVVLTSGTIARAATNASANIAGLTSHSELTLWKSDNTKSFDNQPFGFDASNTATFPADAGQMIVDPLQNIYLDLNVSNTTGWVSGGAQQVNIGSTGGLLLDATTNLYVFDPTQTNAIMRIYAKIEGPGCGIVGDLGGRVRVQFISGLV